MTVLREAQRGLDATQGRVNLRQFDLTARTRGTRTRPLEANLARGETGHSGTLVLTLVWAIGGAP